MEKFEKCSNALSDVVLETEILFKSNHLEDKYIDQMRKVFIPDFFCMVREHYFKKDDTAKALKIYLNHFEYEKLNDAAFITKDTSLLEFMSIFVAFIKMFFKRNLLRLIGKQGFHES